jgi:hypothetical protein
MDPGQEVTASLLGRGPALAAMSHDDRDWGGVGVVRRSTVQLSPPCGVRIALGATAERVRRMVVGQATRLLGSLLFEMKAVFAVSG